MQNKPVLTPSYDNKIYQKYSKKTLKNKVENKLAFQEEHGLIVDKKIPLLCISIELTSEKRADILEEVVEGMLALNIQLAIVGVGSAKYQKLITKLSENYKNKIVVISDTEVDVRKLYAASDIALVTSDKTEDEGEIINYLNYGIVPVAPAKSFKKIKLINYNPVSESGNAFIYEKADKWLVFAAIVRALENFVFPFDWQSIQINCMESTGEDE